MHLYKISLLCVMEARWIGAGKQDWLADADSDHNLLLGKLALKPRKANAGEKKKQRFDIGNFKTQ